MLKSITFETDEKYHQVQVTVTHENELRSIYIAGDKNQAVQLAAILLETEARKHPVGNEAYIRLWRLIDETPW